MKTERSSRASTAGPRSQKKAHLIHGSLSHISSGCMRKPPLVSRLVTHHQSVIISCPGAVSLWSGTGKSEPFLKGKFRGWINFRPVWSVKWSRRAIFPPKISFIRYELLYLRTILGRRLDETPRGPSFHSVIYIRVFDWKIARREFVAVELLSPFLCTHTYLNNLFHNAMMSFVVNCWTRWAKVWPNDIYFQ